MAVTQLSAAQVQEIERAHVATGEAGAALIAGGIGCFIIGLLTTLAAIPALVDLKNALNWWNPAGPLVGKTSVGVIAFVLAWIIGHAILRQREVNLKTYFIVSMALVALGFLLTFPPFFEAFEH
jgi:hypothetical protein